MIRQNTICAVSTASGVGGIAVVRVSGGEAFALCDKIFRPHSACKTLSSQPPYSVAYGTVVDSNDEVIDDVLATVFRAPHSYTGEDTVEISCHGSVYIQQQIVKLLVDAGCEVARAGEFTMRAFVNGKLDLSQAEAVADLISSSNKAMHKMAISQMRGGFSAELRDLRSRLLDFVSLIELELDFSEEDVEFADRTQLKHLARQIDEHIGKLVNSFNLGNALKNGVSVALAGETNVGKSTLLNFLLNEDRAIVSDIEGTTRDVIEDTIVIDGIMFRFIDTAGIRRTTDQIEMLGIQKSFRKIEQAAIVLWIVDCSSNADQIDNVADKVIAKNGEGSLIVVLNKTDKVSKQRYEEIERLFAALGVEVIGISAKLGTNTAALQDLLVKTATNNRYSQDSETIVNNVRHYEALTKAQQAVGRVIDGLDVGISGDLLSQDIRECMYHLGEITGEISTDEMLGNIFGKFCIGK